MSDERKKRLAQLKQAFESGILDEDTYRVALAGLETAGQVQSQFGAIAQGEGATAVGERGVHVGGSVIGDIITGNVYYGDPTDDPQEALRIYCQVLVQSSGSLPLRSIDVNASDPASGQQPLGLAQVYIDLDTKTRVREETLQRWLTGDADDLFTFGLADSVDFIASDQDRGSDKEEKNLPALVAAIKRRQLVLLGDPGGGKTTFVRHLAHCLAAHAIHPDAGWLQHLPGWPQCEADTLPLVVILRDFARNLPSSLPAQASPRHLWDFIAAGLRAQNLDFATASIRNKLEAGQAMLLLDGLDEVPTQAQRRFVRDAVLAFVKRYPGNRALVTCRVLSYQPPVTPDAVDLRLPQKAFLPFELAPFNEEKIDRFIAAWYRELARLNAIPSPDVDGLTQKFQGAVRRPDLWRLASNPLLLTVMALVHSHKGRLPDARALLYEETVDILLWRWEQMKAGGREDAPQLRQLLLQANRTDMDLKKVLWRLAYEAHGQVGGAADGDKLADIGELKLTKALARLKENDLTWASQIVTAMKLRAGLLLERAPELFTFPHRTFQEYLAGAHLSAQANFSAAGTKLAEEGTLWREVILLAVGRLVYLSGDMDKPLALVAELCPSRTENEAAGWYKAWLAGDVLLEIGLQRVTDSRLGRDLLERGRERIAALLAGGKLTPRQRAEAGDTLARLGDPRRGVGVRAVKGVSLPDIELCYVPPGPFWMGSGDNDPMAEDTEKPLHQFDVPYGYWIGRYPVTVAQFKVFVEQSGYRGYKDDDLRDVLDAPVNRPVRYVSWYDALGFCRWLDDVWRQNDWLSDGMSVTLPSEMEWEKAARGGLLIPETPLFISDPNDVKKVDDTLSLLDNPLPQRRYPWGDKADDANANSKKSGIGKTSTVGMFPGGVSPYGVWGMSGNVFDWTRSVWGTTYSRPDFTYPYQPEDGREDLESRELRVLRGGSWFTDEAWLRCACRYEFIPDVRGGYLGFRVVVSPFLPLDSGPSDP